MLVYRGTNNGHTGKKDWPTNFMQGAGLETKQYNQAMDLADAVSKEYEEDFVIVGHSLGGGLASSGVAVTGRKGYTFNSSGLHENTAARRNGLSLAETSDLITSQAVKGEVLTLAQSKMTKGALLGAIGAFVGPEQALLVGAATAALKAIPEASAKMLSLESKRGGSPIARHGMVQVREGIELQKKEDEAILKQYLVG